MKDLLINPYSFDAYKVTRDSQGRALVDAKIMKVGRLKYDDGQGGTFYGNITLAELKKAAKTANLKPVTIKHPPGLVKPSDVTKYQEGFSADGFKVEERDGEQWLVGRLVLQSEKAIETAESGKFGISAGYNRKAVRTNEKGVFDFINIDINHTAIGVDNPRAEGAGLSLDEASNTTGKVYSFAEQQPPKQREIMKLKRTQNAVSVGSFSMDEAPIEYEQESENAIDKMVDRESQLVGALTAAQTSLDEATTDTEKQVGDLSGENKGLKSQIEELETKMKGMISMDDIEGRVKELSDIQAVATLHKIDVKFATPFDGKKSIVEKVYSGQSFDDSEIEGAYKTIQTNEKDTAERLKSKKALENHNVVSMDDRKVGISKVDISALKRQTKKA